MVWTRVAGVGEDPLWKNCGPRYSFYHRFIAIYWPGGPDEVGAATLHRLCTLSRKMGVKSFIVEDGLARPDIVCEIDHLEELSEVKEGEAKAVVVTFLKSKRPASCDGAAINGKAIAGQAVIVSYPAPDGIRTYVYEALFRPPSTGPNNRPLTNHYVPVARNASLTVAGHKHEVRVTYFCEQNGLTSSCAHCAARTLAWHLSGEALDIASLNKKWHKQPGLTSVTTTKIFESMAPERRLIYDLCDVPKYEGETPDDVVWGILSCLAELPRPSILTLRTTGSADHVVSLVGHTINSDEWHPQAVSTHLAGRNSASTTNLWVDHLVLHDDMLGPYYCVGRAGLFEPVEKRPECPHCRRDPARAVKKCKHCGKKLGPPTEQRQTIRPIAVISPLPSGVSVSPWAARDTAVETIPVFVRRLQLAGFGRGEWWKLLRKSPERRLVRTTLISRDRYLESLQGLRELKERPIEAADFDELRDSLPERMWMCEVTLPNLFLGNRAKLGEFLISTTDLPPHDATAAVLAFRLPSVLGWRVADDRPDSVFAVIHIPVLGRQPMRTPNRHDSRW